MKRNIQDCPRQARLACRASWTAMKRRCDDSKYHATKDYKERGISYPEEWKEFKNFLRDLGDPKFDLEVGRYRTLDRKDNNLPYSKSNCRWATSEEQSFNKRICIKVKLGFKD